MRTALLMFMALSCPSILVAQPNSGQELLEFVRDAHRAARESLRTVSCAIKFDANIEKQSGAGRFWFSVDADRGHYAESGLDVDYVWQDAVRREVVRKKSKGAQVTGATRSRLTTRYIARCDPRLCGLLVVNLPGTAEYLPFEQLLDHVTRLKRADLRSIGGSDRVVVQLLFDRSKENGTTYDVEIQFDPGTNYLVRKTTYVASHAKGIYRRENEVTHFKECSPGVFYPERIEGRSDSNGKTPFQPYDAHFRYPSKPALTSDDLPVSLSERNLPDGLDRSRQLSG